MKSLVKNILDKKFAREIIILFFIVLSLLFVSVFTSLAIFQKSTEKKQVASIYASSIYLSISTSTSTSQSSTKNITVSAGQTLFSDVTITNNSSTNARYKLYYLSSGVPSTVTVGVSQKSPNPESSTLNPNSKKTVRVGIRNGSTSSVTVTIGTQAGYGSNYSVDLYSGRKAMGSIKEGDTSGANEPVLASGMIPVKYSESCDNNKGCWVKADTDEEWYNYGKQTWANAVTVGSSASTCSGTSCQDTVTKRTRSYYQSAAAGTPISMDDINSMWVWIPRYKYRITSNRGSSSSVSTPPQIDVVFESGTNATGVSINTSGVANTQYYTHPAFRNGSSVYKSTAYDQGGWNEELTGFWAAKFETGGTATTPLIKPNIVSLRSQNVYNKFLTSLKFAGGTMSSNVVSFSGSSTYGLTSSTNTHMMKNTEWGAIAYLSQSQYGKRGNSNYSGTNKEIYINASSSYITGRSGAGPGGAYGTATSETTTGEDWQVIMHGYDGRRCTSKSGNVCTGSSSNKNLGYGASTTGTIYGIYDMSGGANEYVMGNWNGTSGSSGFSSSFFTSSANKKYLDKYTGTSSYTMTEEKAIFGDATWETMRWFYDSAYFVYSSGAWAARGGNYSTGSSGGIFNSSNTSGASVSDCSSRITLIP